MFLILIDLNWLNLSFATFKINCKKLFFMLLAVVLQLTKPCNQSWHLLFRASNSPYPSANGIIETRFYV